MYVFNAENQCVNSSVLPEDQVKSRTAVLPPLEAGEYRIICLGQISEKLEQILPIVEEVSV